MAERENQSWKRWIPVWIPYAWMLVFFLIPFLIVFKISISTPEIAQPPYVPVFDVGKDGIAGTWEKTKEWTLDNYRRVFGLIDEFGTEDEEEPAAEEDAAATEGRPPRRMTPPLELENRQPRFQPKRPPRPKPPPRTTTTISTSPPISRACGLPSSRRR